MARAHLPFRDHRCGTWVGLWAVLMLAALPLLAATTFSAPTAQTVHPVTYLPLVQRPPYRIAFSSESLDPGRYDIYVMNADGSHRANLTNDPAYVGRPAWSPTTN